MQAQTVEEGCREKEIGRVRGSTGVKIEVETE